MKKFLTIFVCFSILTCCVFAQDETLQENEVFAEEKYEAEKTKTEIIIPKDQHLTDTLGNNKIGASVKIEYSPMYDEVRIYYECMYVTYDRGEAMNSVMACLEDFQKEHQYYSYRYLKEDRERFFKDSKGKRKAQYSSYVKFSR